MLLPMNNQTPKKHYSFLTTLILLVVIVCVGILYWQRQWLYDEAQLINYVAPTLISDLATQDTMTPYARRIYYVNHPGLTTGADFAKACSSVSGGEKTIVLGCYIGGQRGITLLNVSDPLLNGVEQVTAAHEMLHSAYDRLSSSDKQNVDIMLQNYYKNDLHDVRILSIMEAYKKSEPKDVVDEMHSVFGTEIANLPKGLEQYYQKYFTNRATVISFASKYQAEFTNRQNLITSYTAQIADLKTQIANQEANLKIKLEELNNRRIELDGLRNSDVQAYNAGVPGYNSLVNSYNYGVSTLQEMIAEHNSLVAKLNAVVLEQNQLVKELTTNSTTINK
jgi:flagellar biosynthesis chaperone FliJ